MVFRILACMILDIVMDNWLVWSTIQLSILGERPESLKPCEYTFDNSRARLLQSTLSSSSCSFSLLLLLLLLLFHHIIVPSLVITSHNVPSSPILLAYPPSQRFSLPPFTLLTLYWEVGSTHQTPVPVPVPSVFTTPTQAHSFLAPSCTFGISSGWQCLEMQSMAVFC